jgi:hypothetical protein
MDADVDAGHPDGRARRAQASDVCELAECDQRGQFAHSLKTHQRPAAGLAARELTQLTLKRRDLGVDRVDHRQRDFDRFARVISKLERV